MPPIWASSGATLWEKGLGLSDRESTTSLPALESLQSLPAPCTDYIQGREIIAAAGSFVTDEFYRPAGDFMCCGSRLVTHDPGDLITQGI